jgi:beta-lactamase superfamily II metal-dependent hydrolase
VRHFNLCLIGITLLCLTVVSAPAGAQHLRIYYPDVEQGSSAVVVAPTGEAILIDAGGAMDSTEDIVEDFVNDLIAAGVITSLDYTLATHYHEDHIGRMDLVFQLVPMSPTGTAWDRGTFGSVPTSYTYSDYAYGASFHNRTTITANTSISLGGGVEVRCYVVNGELPDSSSVDLSGASSFENSASASVLVTYGDVDIWIGGDLTGDSPDVESAVAPFVGDVDVYTFNHHGSAYSSSSTFLSSLQAEVGLAQSSASNSFGHPNSDAVSRFLATPDSNNATPLFFQQNPGNPDDTRSDDSLADAIADCDDTTGSWALPGTIVLLSDGTSYRISACGIPATSFAADAGVGTIGDYPPAIRRVLRTPQVPLATEGVVIETDVDDEGAVSVEIEYSLDGVSQAPIAMSPIGGNTFSGTIPAQVDGARVQLRVVATDSASQVERSPAQGYFSGTTPIATLRINDANGVLVPKAYGVRVEGNMSVEPGIFHTYVTQAFVQDATGGVQIFDGELLPLSRGDQVEFVGELEQFSGATEVSTAERFGNKGYTLIGAGVAPAPEVVTVAGAGEAVEGRLIRINNVTVIDGVIPESGSGNLTITDDGGVSTMTLRIDGDTDIPGANTPTQPFDVIGIASQFDSWAPLTSGYQVVPRERTDLLSDEINHPQLLISEIHADPALDLAGDANGDGVRDAAADEFIEIVNTGFTEINISGYTLSDGLYLRHTFEPGTIIPAREVAVVFGGGTPTGDFGNAMANGLVFTASTGSLSLNNTGDTVTLADDLGVTVQTVTYGSEGGQDASLVRDPDYSNAPFVLHTTATGSGGSLYSPGTRISGQAFTVPSGALILTEVMYDPIGTDGPLEWFELYNTTDAPISLDGLCVGNGGADYTSSLVNLSGTVAAGATFVVGGPTSSDDNANPVFDLVYDFYYDFQNSGSDADGVALFNISCAQVTGSSVPIDAVVYGGSNTNGLIDETGVANPPEVGDAPTGYTIERLNIAGEWLMQALPTPNVFVDGGPEPPPEGLLLSEVYYDGPSGDDGFEWVELYNSSDQTIDLAAFSLGNGGTTYLSSQVQLSGTVGPGETFVVGGPTSDASNGNPSYDLELDFDPDFQNSGSDGDGVALFNKPAVQVDASTVPVDAVIYGPNNNNGLIDETGVANSPEVGDAPEGWSIERVDLAGAWQMQSSPSPTATSLGGGDTTPPAAPTGLAATAGDGTVGLDWDDNGEPDLDGYNVFRSTTSGSGYTQLNGALVTTSDYSDDTVSNGTTYYYVVTAVDTSSNESAASSEVSATPQGSGATSMYVHSIEPSVIGNKNQQGYVVVTMVDNLGAVVPDVLVTGTFTGDFNETRSDTTDILGEATIITSGKTKAPSYTFCVDSAVHATLSYDSAANLETCDSY